MTPDLTNTKTVENIQHVERMKKIDCVVLVFTIGLLCILFASMFSGAI